MTSRPTTYPTAPCRRRAAGLALARGAALAAVVVAFLGPPAGALAGAAEPDWEAYSDVVRLPLAGVSPRLSVTVALDVARADVVVRVPARGSDDGAALTAVLRRVVAERGGDLVLAVDHDEAEPALTLRFLVASPSVAARVVPAARQRGWLLEVFSLRAAPLDDPALRLPVGRYSAPGALPLWRQAATADLTAARERLEAIEAALGADDGAEAQRLLDALGAVPAPVRPWVALLQADVQLRAGALEPARQTLVEVARGSDDVAAALLARVRLAERTRAVGEDVAPRELVDYALQLPDLPPAVLAELLARRVRGLFVEGRFAEALAAWRALGRVAPGAPAHAALSGVARTARFRGVRAAADRGDYLGALRAAATMAPAPADDVLERRMAAALARSYRALGLFERESEVRLGRLLQPLPGPAVTSELVALVRSYAEDRSLSRAHTTLTYIEQQHGRHVTEAVLAVVRGELALREGRFAAALDGLRGAAATATDGGDGDGDGWAGEAAIRRLQTARLAGELEGPAAAAELLAPLLAAERPLPGAPAGTLRDLRDGLRAAAGTCPAVLADAARVPGPALLLQPQRALAVARCARAARGPAATLALLDALAATAPPLVARAARAEAADLRWELRNAARLERFLAPPAPVAVAAAGGPAAPDTVEEPPQRRRRKARRRRR